MYIERMFQSEVENSSWNGVDDCTFFYDLGTPDFCWTSPIHGTNTSATTGVSLSSNVSNSDKGMKRERVHKRSCQSESKACREKLLREKINDRFSKLLSFLHPEKKVNKVDKSAILCDAISALHRLKSEVQELKERNTKLQADIQSLKAEKNELREEKSQLKASKDNMELKIKGINQAVYGGFLTWQWISPAVLDTSQDHVLRPPVA